MGTRSGEDSTATRWESNGGGFTDLRDGKQFFVDHPGAVPISTAQDEELKKVIGRMTYVECSSKTQQNIKVMFDAAIKVVPAIEAEAEEVEGAESILLILPHIVVNATLSHIYFSMVLEHSSKVSLLNPELAWNSTFFKEPVMLPEFVILGGSPEESARLKASSNMNELISLLSPQSRLVVTSSGDDLPSDGTLNSDAITVQVLVNDVHVGDSVLVIESLERIVDDSDFEHGTHHHIEVCWWLVPIIFCDRSLACVLSTVEEEKIVLGDCKFFKSTFY
uniref:Uncharacterized protein n=1 Tax=Aegilops tauschii TaxID=37682 RepID=N1QZF9_AEGTA